GKETLLTTDGVKDFGYATDNAGWTRSDRPIVVWSPDSRKIATFQQDQRGTGEMYLVDTKVGHPTLHAWKYPLPGDAAITTIERVNWRYLPASNEVIWFSERNNWGQLYLYDLRTGRLENQITTGEGNVTQLLRVDEKNRVVYFLGVGREKGRDPYFTHFYRVGFDGKNLQLLTPENATHEITLAHSGRFFVDAYSTPEAPPIAVLRDADGKEV